MVTGWQSVVGAQLMILILTYINVFFICYIYKRCASFLNNKIRLCLYNYAFMLIAYKMALIFGSGTGIFAIIILSGLINYIFGIYHLVIAHTLAIFTLPFVSGGYLFPKKDILVALLCVLIGVLNPKEDRYNKKYSWFIAIIPTLAGGILFSGLSIKKMLAMWIIGITTAIASGYGSHRIIEKMLLKPYIMDIERKGLLHINNKKFIADVKNSEPNSLSVVLKLRCAEGYNRCFLVSTENESLKAVADIVKNCGDKSDVAFRLSKNTFIITGENASSEYASNLAKKIESRINDEDFLINFSKININVSLADLARVVNADKFSLSEAIPKIEENYIIR